MDDRADFAERQAQMTATWFENVRRTHGDVDKYIALRHKAYVDRWKEAARFIRPDDRVLDVGGGFVFPMLVDFLKSLKIDYHYLDIDPGAVDSAKSILGDAGFNPDHINHGFNDQFAYPDSHFDAVFSSHCIEHSIDLAKTFTELNRIIRQDGYLLMAVPFGWELNPEHPYFFDPDQWIAQVEDAGFEIRLAQIGREYPESGADFFIAARKIQAPRAARIDVAKYTKTSYEFVSVAAFAGERASEVQSTYEGDYLHLRGDAWQIDLPVPAEAREVVPVILRHDWSGLFDLASENGSRASGDLYSWFRYLGGFRLGYEGGPPLGRITLSCRGRNPASHGSECVLYGYMWR